MVDVVQNLWNYSTVAVVHSTNAYSSAAANAFELAASKTGLGISTTRSFLRSSSDTTLQQLALLETQSRVIVMFLSVCALGPEITARCAVRAF